uniref:Uncharacterized protein n=1 Tax=Timema douglasi TaxID=61478 RepID=A0A7R8VKS1_TIMDO|nr:unnamed protein product [Timema douglasi]
MSTLRLCDELSSLSRTELSVSGVTLKVTEDCAIKLQEFVPHKLKQAHNNFIEECQAREDHLAPHLAGVMKVFPRHPCWVGVQEMELLFVQQRMVLTLALEAPQESPALQEGSRHHLALALHDP